MNSYLCLYFINFIYGLLSVINLYIVYTWSLGSSLIAITLNRMFNFPNDYNSLFFGINLQYISNVHKFYSDLRSYMICLFFGKYYIHFENRIIPCLCDLPIIYTGIWISQSWLCFTFKFFSFSFNISL